MKAVRLAATREFDVVSLPEPEPEHDEVVVRVEAVSICGSDVAGYVGRHPRIRPPVILGHEFSGRVETVGSEVTKLAVGTRVAIDPIMGCGSCQACRTGRPNICRQYRVMGEETDIRGGFAPLVAVRAIHALALPDSVSIEAAALAQPMSIAVHAVEDRGRVERGERVLVVGAGPIGTACMLVSRRLGASVTVAEPLAGRRERAHALGATEVVDVPQASEEAAECLVDDTFGFDVAFEAAGGVSDAAFDLATRSVRPGGRVITLGTFANAKVQLCLRAVKMGELDIRGSQAYPTSTFRRAIDGIADGSLPVLPLITHRFPVELASEAFNLLTERPGSALKILLTHGT